MATIPQTRLFVGYSTVDALPGKQQFTDIELIKRDLLNAFYTKRGERVMRPNYGCIIWDLLFEPLNDSIKAQVIDDATRIVQSDSRVKLDSINVTQFDYGLQVQMNLFFTPYQVFSTFDIEFDQRSAQEFA